jgi:hypothetical protein
MFLRRYLSIYSFRSLGVSRKFASLGAGGRAFKSPRPDQ